MLVLVQPFIGEAAAPLAEGGLRVQGDGRIQVGQRLFIVLHMKVGPYLIICLTVI